MKSYKNSISIIFPVLNGPKDTLRCLESIAKLNYPKEKIEIIIIDNGSKKRFSTLRMKNVNIIRNKTNIGFGAAVNQGAKIARGEFIFITNNDVTLEKNCLEELVGTVNKSKRIGIAGGNVYRKGTKENTYDGYFINPYLAFHQSGKLNKKQECGWISGCMMLVRKSVFDILGGFDPSFFFYFEDVDFCLRAKKAGFKIMFNPKAIVYHGYGQTIFKKPLHEIFETGFRSRIYCVLKNCTFPQKITSMLFLLIIAPFYPSLKTRNLLYLPMFKALWSLNTHTLAKKL